jgi:hypothetical protein
MEREIALRYKRPPSVGRISFDEGDSFMNTEFADHSLCVGPL